MTEDTIINEEDFDTQLVVIEDRALTVIEKSRELEIVDDAGVVRSVSIEKEMKAGKKSILDHFKPFKEALNKKHKNATAKEKEHVTPFTEEIDNNKDKRDKYIAERNLKLKAEQEEREKKEAAERKRQLTIIQNQLDKDMASAGDLDSQVDMILDKLEAPDLPETEADMLRSKLTVLQSKQEQIRNSIAAKAQKAEEVVSAPSVAPPVVPAKVDGLVQKKEYTVVVFDPKELCRAIADGKVSPDIIKWDMVALKSLTKAKVELPGCKVTSEMKSHTR